MLLLDALFGSLGLSSIERREQGKFLLTRAVRSKAERKYPRTWFRDRTVAVLDSLGIPAKVIGYGTTTYWWVLVEMEEKEG